MPLTPPSPNQRTHLYAMASRENSIAHSYIWTYISSCHSSKSSPPFRTTTPSLEDDPACSYAIATKVSLDSKASRVNIQYLPRRMPRCSCRTDTARWSVVRRHSVRSPTGLTLHGTPAFHILVSTCSSKSKRSFINFILDSHSNPLDMLCFPKLPTVSYPIFFHGED